MTALKEIEKFNKIDREEFDILSDSLFESFLISNIKQSQSFIFKQEKLIDLFSSFLEKYMELNISKTNKLELINIIDKLNMQRELLEIKSGEIKINDVKVIAQRFGKKSQSAFKTKVR